MILNPNCSEEVSSYEPTDDDIYDKVEEFMESRKNRKEILKIVLKQIEQEDYDRIRKELMVDGLK